MINLVDIKQFIKIFSMGTTLYNFDYLKELSDGDKDFEQNMLDYFVSNTPNVVLTIDKLISEQNWKQIREEIHRFIPNLNMVGASLLLDDANNIEKYTENLKNLEEVPGLWNTLRGQCNVLVKQLQDEL